MKTVVLVGDSIRIGYQDTVRRELAGLAEVVSPSENGGDSAKVRANLDEWIISHAPDVVHLNCGLHDLKREFGSQAHQVDLPDYRANLEDVFGRLRAETEAALVWATTTPVNEKWHHENKGFDRFEADVELYNAAARELAGPGGAAVDDLFGVITEAGRDELLSEDGVHFKPEGYEILGKAVAECIRKTL